MEARGEPHPGHLRGKALGGVELSECAVLPAHTMALESQVCEAEELKSGEEEREGPRHRTAGGHSLAVLETRRHFHRKRRPCFSTGSAEAFL
jgi:hypothetical protein